MNIAEAGDEDPIFALVRHAVGIGFDDLPADVIAFQKRRLLDNVGACLAGRNSAGCRETLELARRYGGVRQAQVLGYGDRLPVAVAAMQNAVMSRALDFCDAVPPGYHPSSTDVPAALAVAQWRGRPGRDVVRALAVAQDVVQRINLSAQSHGTFYNGFDPNILAPLSATLVAGLLMGLEADALRNAVGLAFNTSAGSFQAYQDKTLAVRLAQGQATRNGIEAALLAEAGLTGPRRILSGECGFHALFVRRATDPDALLEGLGKVFHGREQTLFKLYPSCGLTLCMTDVALRLNRALDHGTGMEPDRIAAVEVTLSSGAAMVCGQAFSPSRETPDIDAAFSAQYVVASALLRGVAGLDEFTPMAVFEPIVMDMARSIGLTVDPSFGYDQCRVSIRLKDGSEVCDEGQYGRGWPQNPASQRELEAKFRACAAFASPRIADGRSEAIIAMVDALETLDTIDPLIALCVVQEPMA